MAALWSRCRHYIFALWFLLSIFFPHLISAVADWMPTILPDCVALVWIQNVCLKCTAHSSLKIQDAKNYHLGTITQLCQAVSSQLRHVSTIRKKLLNSNTSSTCPHNMVNFGPLTAEIGSGVWGTPANFNGYRVLAALLHDTLVVGISQTLRGWTEGATNIRQGGHHVGHWPTF